MLNHIHTVSLARTSGSSRPLDWLYISMSQQRNTEASKDLTPSKHCNMIPLVNQNAP
jgi:hypothetical protein